MDAMYAFSFVLANFGIAIAARMPMMTTTIRSSISVKPFLLDIRIAVSSWIRFVRVAGAPAARLFTHLPDAL